ncbi:protein kinase [Kitasatospora sp. NPDC048365]|uniref:protein kinase domain-containing protein n=1 Tax=Kitasatospora sp. NPDC048365 TaxID=3364050 RepID=UPI00372496EA
MQYTPYDEWAGLIGDRYALREVIGHGGMGEVWSAEDLVLHRAVAVKLMHPQLALDDVAQSRFQREVRAAASLNHPRVAAVHDAGRLATAPPRPFLVMEHVSGHTAAELLRAAPPSPEEAVAWVAGTLEALACAHAAGLVHRDIKPANVMITSDGLVKVMDFGIAHIADGHDTGLTGTGNAVGTTAYMSPEQAQGLPVDARSDLYSTGCMLYELLTGLQPYVGDSPFAVAYQHICAAAPSPADIGIRLPPHVEAALARAMAKNPDDRFPDAAAMREALLAPPAHTVAGQGADTLLEPPAVEAAPARTVTTPAGPRHSPRPSRRLALAGLALLGTCAGLTAVITTGPDIPHATGPTAQTTTATESSTAAPSATRSDSARPDRSAGPSASPHASTEPATRTVAVPDDLVGKTLAQATAELAGLGLDITLTPGSSSSRTSTVTATAPPAGTQLGPGDTVLLTTRSAAEATSTPRATSSTPSGGASSSAGSSPSTSVSPTPTRPVPPTRPPLP